jgi:hypothetical protein
MYKEEFIEHIVFGLQHQNYLSHKEPVSFFWGAVNFRTLVMKQNWILKCANSREFCEKLENFAKLSRLKKKKKNCKDLVVSVFGGHLNHKLRPHLSNESQPSFTKKNSTDSVPQVLARY